MSLFNHYNKPGPGVLKNNGYEPNRFTLYFQLLGRKFWSLCILNLIFVLFSAPFVALSILLYNFLGRFAFISVLGFQFHFLFSLLPFAFIGPVLGAVFKGARDFAREEPVFIFSDFLSTLKKNIGKPIALSAISYKGEESAFNKAEILRNSNSFGQVYAVGERASSYSCMKILDGLDEYQTRLLVRDGSEDHHIYKTISYEEIGKKNE